MKTGIALIDKYTYHFYRELKYAGFSVQVDDVMSELGYAYTKAKIAFVEGNTTFNTFCIECFQNQIRDLKKELTKEERKCRVPLRDCVDEKAERCESILIYEEMKRKLLLKFKGNRLLIAKEQIDPSAKVRNYLHAHMCKFGNQTGKLKGNGAGALTEALSAIYGYDKHYLREEIRIIRDTAKKYLYNFAKIQ